VNKLCKAKADGDVCKKSMFVGMDVHKNYLQVAVLDEKGKVLDNSRVDNNLAKVNEFFDSLHPRCNTKVVLESSGMWYNIYECLSKRHLDVRLSNPVKTSSFGTLYGIIIGIELAVVDPKNDYFHYFSNCCLLLDVSSI
jgi:hypothetical protein